MSTTSVLSPREVVDIPDCPGSCSVDQADLKLTESCLSHSLIDSTSRKLKEITFGISMSRNVYEERTFLFLALHIVH